MSARLYTCTCSTGRGYVHVHVGTSHRTCNRTGLIDSAGYCESTGSWGSTVQYSWTDEPMCIFNNIHVLYMYSSQKAKPIVGCKSRASRFMHVHVPYSLESVPMGACNRRPKNGVGAYTGKPVFMLTHICLNHRIIKKGGVGAYSREYSTCIYAMRIPPSPFTHTRPCPQPPTPS